jgi:coproporphyrinogen III oxidase-like Fe-S oxidoreductase
MDSYKLNLRKAVLLRPHHISAYSLTWNTSTILGRQIKSNQLPKPDEDIIGDMFDETHNILSDAGYEHYEISNFARPGCRCLHNEGYWTGKPYFGMGPSAHSFLNDERYWNISDINKYISVLSHHKLPVEGREELSPEQIDLEHIYLGLRRKEGIPVNLVQDKKDSITVLLQSNLATLTEGILALTPKGLCVADELTLKLIN